MNRNKFVHVLIVPIILCTLFISCSGGKEEMTEKAGPYMKISDVPDEAWKELSAKKIYFGHQSVGNNVIDGMETVMKKYPQIRLNIEMTSDLRTIDGGCFAHSGIGRNMDPSSKINDFDRIVRDGMGNTADVAFFKFCYVDLNTNTDLDSLFNQYKETMDRLSAEYPKTQFVHLTVPLTTKPDGLKGFIKKAKDLVKSIVGKDNMYDNKVKYDFNEKLRKEYGKSGKFFDIALSESSYPDGRQLFEKRDGENVQLLIPEYSNDGGHLNEDGKVKVAEDFLLFLVNL